MAKLDSPVPMREKREPGYPARRDPDRRSGSPSRLGLGRRCARVAVGLAAAGWLSACGPTDGSLPTYTPSPADQDQGNGEDSEATVGPEGSQGNDDHSSSDRDGDGVLDGADRCPDEPEDQDSYEDEDGCPDLDNDQDGVADLDDACPMIPGEVGVQSGTGDGCPVRMVGVMARPVSFPHQIRFTAGATAIPPRQLAILTDVVETMRANQQVQLLVIEGHTDNREPPANRNGRARLAQARAEAVLDFLVTQGVDRSRLRAVGYADTRPIDSNGTAGGREANRRVSFLIEDSDDSDGESPPKP